MLLVLYTQLVHHAADQLVQWQMKEAAFEAFLKQAPEALCDAITYDDYKHDIIWEEQGKEFSLHGKMYDVAKVKQDHGKTILLCVADAKEDELLSRLKDATNRRKQQGAAQMAAFVFLYDDGHVYRLDTPVSAAIKLVFAMPDDAAVALSTGIETPPPKA